ncbi:hypothetical protein OAG16_01590, partial [Saprospiraceae bacterium]|nr:hypothetical protein [Saprospiraceae bacterium]
VNYHQLPNRKKLFFENLPDKFQRKEAVEVGGKLGISSATVGRWLKQMTEDYLEQSEYGMYQKVKNDKVDKMKSA